MMTISRGKLVCAGMMVAGSLMLSPDLALSQAQSQTTNTQQQPAAPNQTPAATQNTAAQQTPAASPSTSNQAPGQAPANQNAPTATTTPNTAADQTVPANPPGANLPPVSSQEGDPTVPGVKHGSKNDVNAVGNRNIGARGLGNWYSTEGEIRMGKQYAAELEKSVKFINDPVVNEYVNRIGQNLVKNSDAKVPFTIKVIDSDEVNAMALPGGFFYVNSGLILAADEEAELAGVMAHEIGHVAAHHAAREQTRMNIAQLSMVPLIMVTGYSWTGYGIYEAANIGIPIAFLQFSRGFESQADYLGVQYMYRAGYDPQAFVTFFEKIQNLEKHKPGAVAKAFSTHPQTPDRIEATQKEINTILPPREEYVVTTSEFDDVKARLARIENKRKLKNGDNNNKPTLRRASTSNNDPTNPGDQQGDDRPTLHRRDD